MARLAAASALALVLTACDRGGDRPASPTVPEPVATSPGAQGCSRTSVGFAPLTDLAGASYLSEPMGLYPGSSNVMPGTHAAAGLAIARALGPLDTDGRPSQAGRYAFVSIGMSNTTQEFSVFKPLGDAEPGKHSRLVIVDGAQGGMTAADWASPGCLCWSTLEQRLRSAGVSPAQVVVAWVKLANRQPSGAAATAALRNDIAAVLEQLKVRLPNLAIAYLSSRIYAGYATTALNPEPYAYESGFAVRGVIDQQLRGGLNFDASLGPVRAPWIAWGPYLWADGLRARADGLIWACSDFQSDGTHPSESGRRKVAQLLLEFIRSDPTAREWFYQ